MKMKYDITAIGNALVDTQFKVSHKLIEELGLQIDQMNLSNAEEQAPIINRLIKEKAESISDCGGSATNTLVAASNFGAKCFHTCVVANDEDGHRYLNSLKTAGIKHVGKMHDPKNLPTGKCLILVTPDAKRTMTTALNVSSAMSEMDLDLESISDSKIFYIEGYMVTGDENYQSLIKVLDHLNDYPSVKKALSLSDPGIVGAFIDRFKKIESYGLDFIFCNADEANAFTNTNSTQDSVGILLKKPYTTIITRGMHGCITISKGKHFESQGRQIDAVDSNGAGDMFAGCFLYAFLQDCNLQSCADFSNYGASKVVESFGPRLNKVGYEEVLKNIKKY